ncbi:MAG: RsmB/NOP family class I SAM-dependent RNA methyltransferase [Alphaproteobacteria bacterium]
MRPSSRIQAVIEIYEKIDAAKIPMDAVVGDYMRHRRYIGSKDRADIAERTYNVMRAWGRLNWWLERAGAEATPRNALIANTVLAENADENKIKDFFDGSKFAPAPLNGEEIALFERFKGKSLDHPDMPEAVRVECPPYYEEALRGYFGADFADELKAMQKSATLDMRANVFVAPRDKVKALLAKDGVETDDTPFSPWGLRARDKAYLSKTKAFAKGLVEIQDEGSQMIAHVCGAKRGMQVLDFCAGGGGKTLALAAAMERKGRIVAMDMDERRLQKGKERFRKAQVADIVEVRPLSEERHRKWLRRQKETFDIVLCDVPCTGTGTWRRNPDKRWKLYGPGLEELTKTQGEILDKVAGCVKPGGRLVYATCSLLPVENENQVEEFLKRHPQFSVSPVDERLGAPFMRLTPRRHNTDGFFAAVLVKNATQA